MPSDTPATGKGPHETLAQTTPGRHCQPSLRPYPGRAYSPQYEPHVTALRVRSNGEIRRHGQRVLLIASLTGDLVGLTQLDDLCWSIHFGALLIGRLHHHTGSILRDPTKVYPCLRSNRYPFPRSYR